MWHESDGEYTGIGFLKGYIGNMAAETPVNGSLRACISCLETGCLDPTPNVSRTNKKTLIQ